MKKTSTRLPWFPNYPADFLSDANIALMTIAEVGGYRFLLDHAWNDPDCTLPDDDKMLASLSRMGDEWTKESAAKLRACFFMPHPKKPGRLIDSKLYERFLKVTRFCNERRASGTKGAKSRWKDKQLHDGLDNGSAIAQPLAQPMANDGYSEPEPEPESESKKERERRDAAEQKTQIPASSTPGSLSSSSNQVRNKTVSLSDNTDLQAVLAAYASHRLGTETKLMKAWRQMENLPAAERPTVETILAGITSYSQSQDWNDGRSRQLVCKRHQAAAS
jgi:uncharacterized protein YdaU (DUF1376 family)